MPNKPCCAKCGKEYRPVLVGIGVLELRDDGSPYRLSAADLLECQVCKHQITWGYGEAVHCHTDPEKVRRDIKYYEKYTRLIKVY